MKCKNPKCGHDEYNLDTVVDGCCLYCCRAGVPALLARIERLKRVCSEFIADLRQRYPNATTFDCHYVRAIEDALTTQERNG